MSNKDLFQFIWHFIKPYKFVFFLAALLSCVWSIDATLWPYILKKVINIFQLYDHNRSEAWSLLLSPVFSALALWISVEIGFRGQGFLLAKSLPQLEAKIRIEMFEHVQNHSPKYFNDHFAGSLTNKINDMVSQTSNILQNVVSMFIPGFVTCILAVVFFVKVNPFFAFLLALWVCSHYTICILFTRKCDHYENIHGEARTTLIGKIVDTLTNNHAVNLFYRFSHEKSFILHFQKEELKKNKKAKLYVEKMRLFLSIFAFFLAGIGINGAIIYFWLKGSISTGDVAQLFNTTWNIAMILWLTGTTIPQLFQSFGLAKQALSIMNHPQDILDDQEARDLIISKGDIVFKNVSFNYGKKQLFRHKDVFIKGGQKVGLVGFSGAGKSTFVNLILRLYPLSEGKIYIDGQEIAKVTLESLRKHISLIPQDPILFHRTLRENICYGKLDASEEEMILASQRAYCHDFISNLSEGYETMVGERGTKLSGGERQRIAIARALLANTPILILDEATSSLDSVTEQYIQDALHQLMKNKTTLVIAHRLSTLAKMERILVFNQGKIIEDGSHQELLEKEGRYAHMWRRQSGGFLPEI